MPATAPVLLKKALEPPPPPLELSSAPVGLCTICVTVMTRPAEVVTYSEVKDDGVAVVTEPFASVMVVTKRDVAVVSEGIAEMLLGVTTTVEVLKFSCAALHPVRVDVHLTTLSSSRRRGHDERRGRGLDGRLSGTGGRGDGGESSGGLYR